MCVCLHSDRSPVRPPPAAPMFTFHIYAVLDKKFRFNQKHDIFALFCGEQCYPLEVIHFVWVLMMFVCFNKQCSEKILGQYMFCCNGSLLRCHLTTVKVQTLSFNQLNSVGTVALFIHSPCGQVRIVYYNLGFIFVVLSIISNCWDLGTWWNHAVLCTPGNINVTGIQFFPFLHFETQLLSQHGWKVLKENSWTWKQTKQSHHKSTMGN